MTLKCLFASLILVFSSAQAFAEQVRVVRVSDGDTVHVEPVDGGERMRVRLYGIDCPEKDQPHGSIAAAYLTKAALYQEVELTSYSKDRYGRILGVLEKDGENLNQNMVRDGLAWVYTRYCKKDFCKDWESLQKQARINKTGLWENPDAVSPWKWRKMKKN